MCQPASLACLLFKVDPIVMTKNVSNVGWVHPRILPKLTLPVSLYKTHQPVPGSHDWFSVLSQLRINLHSFAFHPLLGSKILISGCLHAVSPGYCVPGLYDTCFCGPLCSALTITSRERAFSFPIICVRPVAGQAASQPGHT